VGADSGALVKASFIVAIDCDFSDSASNHGTTSRLDVIVRGDITGGGPVGVLSRDVEIFF